MLTANSTLVNKKRIKMKSEVGQCMAYNSGNKCAGCMKLFMAECCTGFDQEQQKCLLEAIPYEKRFYDMTAWHYQYIRGSVEIKDFALQEVLCCPFVKVFWSFKPCKLNSKILFCINVQFTASVEESQIILGMYTGKRKWIGNLSQDSL